MNILIIGGSGHLSGAVARAALEEGHHVWTVTRRKRSLPQGICALTADRNDPVAFTQTVREADIFWDLVVDCICYDLPEMQHAIKLFQTCARQYVFVSTDFVYDPEKRRVPQPVDAPCISAQQYGSLGYGYKKRCCEMGLESSNTGELEWTVVRPCHIYGPTSELGCLPLHGRDRDLIPSLQQGKTLTLVGGGHLLQQPILASDLAQTIVSIGGNAAASGRIFNTAGPDVIESRQYFEIVADILGVPCRIEEIPVDSFLAENPGQRPFICDRVYDLTPLADAGLHVPQTSITDGLRQHTEALIPTFRQT